jgi:hypothetical protein
MYDERWFDVSLYYNSTEWNALLNKSIAPLLEQPSFRQTVDMYHLFFSDKRGDNIRLHFRLRDDKKLTSDTLAHIEHHFTGFLLKNPSPEDDPALPTSEFFLPFANNSIRYNTFFPYVYPVFPKTFAADPFIHELVYLISGIIINGSLAGDLKINKLSKKMIFIARLHMALIYTMTGDHFKTKLFFDQSMQKVKAEMETVHSRQQVLSYLLSLDGVIKSEASSLTRFYRSLAYPKKSENDMLVKELGLRKQNGFFSDCNDSFENLNAIFSNVNHQLNLKTELLLLSLITEGIRSAG